MSVELLIVVAGVALDWAIAFVVWQGLKRVLGRAVSPRLSAVMPWVLFQVFLLVGVVVTGALGDTNNGAVALTGMLLALFSSFFAVPVALFRARGARKIEWRICLDHSYATLAVWTVVFVAGLAL